MSEDASPDFRMRIVPEPTPDELVALLASMQREDVRSLEDESPASRWARVARREQLRTPLDETWEGWNP